jgi:hypothetical protein
LAAMFGGLEDFIKLKRGLNQNTEDREFLAKDRDLRLRGGEQDVKMGGVRLGREEFAAGRDPREAGLRDLTAIKGLGNAESLTQDAITAALGSGGLSDGLFQGIQREVSRNKVSDQIQGSQATIQQNAATGSGIRTGALQKVAAGGLDPVNNQQDLNTFSLAGVEGRPTYGQTVKDQKDILEDTQSHQTTMQGAGFRHDETMNTNRFDQQVKLQDRGLPPGLDVQTATMLDTSLKQLENQADQVSREIAMIDREIAENTTRIGALRGSSTPELQHPQVVAAEAALQGAQAQKTARIARVQQAADMMDKMISGMNITNPQTLSYVQARRNAALATLAQAPVGPAAAGGAGTKKPAL